MSRYRLDLIVFVQDVAYLSPIIKEIEAEEKERLDLETLSITKRKA